MDRSQEMDIRADGQLLAAGLDVQISATELEAEIDKHLLSLQASYAEQTAKVQSTLPNYDDIQQNFERFQKSIQGAESDKTRKAYVRSFQNIAEAYDTLAITTTQLQADASAIWESAWNILNKENLKATIAVSNGRQDMLANDYVELLFARGMHYLRILKVAPDEASRRQAAQSAFRAFYTYLTVVHKLGLSHWQQKDAVRNIHIAVTLGGISQEQLQSDISTVTAHSTIQSPNDALKQALQDVQAYKLPDKENNQQSLLALIY